jgi:YggT family protein
MSPAVQEALIFLVNAIFTFYIFVLLIRFILAWVRADYYNPIAQFFIKLTQPVIAPLKRIIPNYKNFELSTIVLVILVELMKFSAAAYLKNINLGLSNMMLLTLADIFGTLFNIFFYAILIQAISSWFNQGYSTMSELLSKVTSPIMRPLHRVIPPVGGIDLSPVAAMILLQFLNILVVGMLLPNSLGMVPG